MPTRDSRRNPAAGTSSRRASSRSPPRLQSGPTGARVAQDVEVALDVALYAAQIALDTRIQLQRLGMFPEQPTSIVPPRIPRIDTAVQPATVSRSRPQPMSAEEERRHIMQHPDAAPLLIEIQNLDHQYVGRSRRGGEVAAVSARRTALEYEVARRTQILRDAYRNARGRAQYVYVRLEPQEQRAAVVHADVTFTHPQPYASNDHSDQEEDRKATRDEHLGPPAVFSDLVNDPEVQAMRNRLQQHAVSQWAAPSSSQSRSFKGKERATSTSEHDDTLPSLQDLEIEGYRARTSTQETSHAARAASGLDATATDVSQPPRDAQPQLASPSAHVEPLPEVSENTSAGVGAAFFGLTLDAPATDPVALINVAVRAVEEAPIPSVSAVHVRSEGPSAEPAAVSRENKTPPELQDVSLSVATAPQTDSPHVRWGEPVVTLAEARERRGRSALRGPGVRRSSSPFPVEDSAAADVGGSDDSDDYAIVDGPAADKDTLSG